MKLAYFVVGPESSGTKLMARVLCECGCYGDSGYSQRLDDLRFQEAPGRIVFRRSLPHGGKWPPLYRLTKLMDAAGYEVLPVLMLRDWQILARAQVRAGHAQDENEAHSNIVRAYQLILSAFGQTIVTVDYHYFRSSEDYRWDVLHRVLGLADNPAIAYHDADRKHLL